MNSCKAERRFDKANEAMDRGDDKRAFKLFMKAARKGSPYACNSLATFYDAGMRGVKMDKWAARKWYLRAVECGDFLACENLSAWYKEMKNHRKAELWMKKAYDHGSGSAAYKLGRMYLRRPRTELRLCMARRFLEEALRRSRFTSEYELERANRLLAKMRW